MTTFLRRKKTKSKVSDDVKSILTLPWHRQFLRNYSMKEDFDRNRLFADAD